MPTLTISPQGAQPPEITDHADTAAAFAASGVYAQSRGQRVNELAIAGGSLTAATCGIVHQATATGMIREVNS